MLKKMYLAGSIFQCEDYECINWRNNVKDCIRGMEVLDPMIRDYRKTTNEDFKEIVEKDKIEIDASDILLVYYAKPSVGTSMEILYAWERGKKIYIISEHDEISPWLLYHSHKIFTSITEAMEYLNKT